MTSFPRDDQRIQNKETWNFKYSLCLPIVEWFFICSTFSWYSTPRFPIHLKDALQVDISPEALTIRLTPLPFVKMFIDASKCPGLYNNM